MEHEQEYKHGKRAADQNLNLTLGLTNSLMLGIGSGVSLFNAVSYEKIKKKNCTKRILYETPKLKTKLSCDASWGRKLMTPHENHSS